MASQLNDRQRSVENAADFRANLSVLYQAAVRVILCRTREPYRAIETIREFAFAESGLEFKVWSVLNGWVTYERRSPRQESETDGQVQPLPALQAINGTGQTPGFGTGVYVMMYPHPILPKNPAMIQCVKEYCKLFSETKKVLVLLTPQGFNLPVELEDDVAILDYEVPSYSELHGIYDRLMASISDARRPGFNHDGVDRIVAAGSGMTAHEFENAVSRSLVLNRNKLPCVTVEEMSAEVLAVKTEVVKRSNVLELMDGDSMENVGGLANLKSWARDRAHCFSQDALDFGIEPPKGILLAGPPGTGKSLCAKAIASLLGLPLIKFDVARVFQSLVGSSEENVRAALKMVDSMAPCVLMIDEADKAFNVNTGGGDAGVGQRILGTILTWMQDSKAAVFTVLTANRVEQLPSEFIRRGRLDDIFSVTVPNDDERMAILEIHLRLRGKDPSTVQGLDVARDTSDGYVGSEIEAAVKDAIIEAFVHKKPLTGALIAEQMQYMVPISIAFADQFTAMQQWAQNNARPANGTDENAKPARPIRQRRRMTTGKRALVIDGI